MNLKSDRSTSIFFDRRRFRITNPERILLLNGVELRKTLSVFPKLKLESRVESTAIRFTWPPLKIFNYRGSFKNCGVFILFHKKHF